MRHPLPYLMLAAWLILPNLSAQTQYFGFGNDQNITITASDEASPARHSLDGSGTDLDIQGAARFLTHATLGPTIEDIEQLSDMGYEAWIDEQLAIPAHSHTIATVENIFFLYDECRAQFGDLCLGLFIPNSAMWRLDWWDNAIQGEDLLRQRVALALSEWLVISDQSQLNNAPHGLANYYDVLVSNAFGNYQDLLMDITLNINMGHYLSHLNNPKSKPELNIHPDENYAREIMQLFTIGLYELNNDGSRKLDANGKWIPTYDNDDIKGLAKVFTGLSGDKRENDMDPRPISFGRPYDRYDKLRPMVMYEEHHEPGPKTIVGNFTIAEGQTGMEDIEMAIDHLFHHPNVGPFVARHLIQRLIKSNPSPAYIDRIASVFNDNGAGVRGDLSAVVKALLLDEEAMACYWMDDLSAGQLREPILRYTQLLRSLKARTPDGKVWNTGETYQFVTEQHTLSSPTVFNFFQPDYEPNSDFAYYNYAGPEYQILNSSTASNYVNFLMATLMRDYVLNRFGLGEDQLRFFITDHNRIPFVREQLPFKASLTDPLWQELAFEPEQLIDYLDILLANGNMSEETRSGLLGSLNRSDLFTDTDLPFYALLYTMIHPDYLIKK